MIEVDISSGEFCDCCNEMCDVFVNLPLDSQHPYRLCKNCVRKAAKLVDGDTDG